MAGVEGRSEGFIPSDRNRSRPRSSKGVKAREATRQGLAFTPLLLCGSSHR